ncbi:proline dioxygenase [Acidovorax sp. SRB_14]|uniref:2OG-Fe(II) oxygenase n=1 Tax=Acidovorax sp. SRB_14 TaxID=1962699 RepID=UPI00146CE407|nr:2OG-Fe(II) oxygenase [Acidovorax sp. SRB_14]NMM80094.1 proline dioxygenase [Acidovorax sp. SRB_14]NMM88810.1 proline dioxygenase [Rhodococcus sp. SRB_17]
MAHRNRPSAGRSRPASTRSTAPAVTPALREWIIAQAQANVAAPALLQSMQDAGWAEDVAMEALESTLREHLSGVAEQQGLPPVVPVPEPTLQTSPARINVGDRQVDVLVSLALPRLVVFANLLSAEECEALIDAARPRMARSLTVATRTGGEEVNGDRTSRGMFFPRGDTAVVRTLEARIAKLVHWPVENGEGLQVLHYPPGAEYKPHYDYFDPTEPGTPTLLRRGGQRVATLLVYLNTPTEGGGTTFPHAHMEVAAQRGNAVFFSYERPHPDTRTLHGGAPVLSGEKWIATKWLREREFN